MTAFGGHSPDDEILGRYRLVRHIATGGMGVVWEAHDRDLDQTVALKHVRFESLLEPDAEASRRRTLREARLAAQLRGHPHVVSIYDVQQVDGDVWLVLEFLPSRSLAELTAYGATLDIGEAARIGAAIAEALTAAHDRRIVHRDVKPGNVLLSLDGSQIKLTDFGIAHAEGEHPLTQANVVSGTPAYMSREVARGDAETSASDVFSLGATLYKAVEGRPPFGEDTNSRRMLQRVANGQVQPPQQAGPFGPLLMHLLELDPNTRPDARHARDLLDDFARQLREPTHPPTLRSDPRQGPHYPPPPGPHPGHASGDRAAAAPPRRRSRRRVVAAGLAAVTALCLVAAGLVWFTNEDASAVPQLPESVAPVALTGDPVAADPCALLDPAVMSRYGLTKTGSGVNLGECRITMSPAQGPPLAADARFSTTAAEAVTPAGSPRDLGGLRITNRVPTPSMCSAALTLADNTLISLDAEVIDGSTTSTDLCEIRDVMVAVAVDKLATVGISYRPDWQATVSLFGKKACDLPADSLDAIAGLNAGQRIAPPNGSFCYIGRRVGTQPYLVVRLGLDPDGQMGTYGTPSTVDGMTTYVQQRPQYRYTAAPNACQVYLVHKPSYDGGVSGPAEYIAAQLEGPAPVTELCTRATEVVSAAERNAK